MTERAIQNHLWPFLRMKGHEYMCPNFTPLRWFECDMFSVTANGYFVEHEIKLSASDFRADTKKTDGRRSKHERLRLADPYGPSRFWFVMPTYLVPPSEVPDWAGVIWVNAFGKRLVLDVAKSAPKLHKEPCSPVTLKGLGKTFYWRFWRSRGVRDPGCTNDYQI